MLDFKPIRLGLAVVLVAGLFVPPVSAQRPRRGRVQLHEDHSAGFLRFAGGCYATSVAIQPDKKVVAAGSIGKPGKRQMIVVRFNADRTLDTSFGEKSGDTRKGYVQVSVGSDVGAEGIVIEPITGNILVAGSALAEGKPHAAMVRLLPEGEVDKSFQDGGSLLYQFESQVTEGSSFGLQPTWCSDLAMDMRGNLLIVGYLALRDRPGTAGFEDGSNALTVPMKGPPYTIYSAGYSVITNVIKTFDHVGSVQVGQSSLGFCQRSFGISYDESTDRLATGGKLGNDLIVVAMDTRPEVIPEIRFKNPFKEAKIDSCGRAFEHLSNGRIVVAGHGRPYDAKDNTDRRFQLLIYEGDGTLVAHDRSEHGAGAAALALAVQDNSLIALAGRVISEPASETSATFKMGFVLYDGDGNMIGKPWTFDVVQEARVETL